MEEAKERLKAYNREMHLQRRDRLDKEFTHLRQGTLCHADFRALWEEILDEMIEVGMCETKDPDTLKRRYQGKISDDLRYQALSKVWYLDGPDKPPRECKT